MILKAVYFAIQAKLGILRSSEQEFRELSNLLPLDGVAVDIGSNIGRYALEMSRIIGTKGLVISIDPSTRMGWIQSIILFACNRKNVKFFNCGLSDKPSLGNYLADPTKPKSALFTTYSTSKCNSNLQNGDTSIISTLDNLLSGIKSLDLIKIDAEGQEIAILQGALEIILIHKPIIIVENNDPDSLNALMVSIGYEPKSASKESRNIIFASATQQEL